jgi:hypothetical protein
MKTNGRWIETPEGYALIRVDAIDLMWLHDVPHGREVRWEVRCALRGVEVSASGWHTLSGLFVTKEKAREFMRTVSALEDRADVDE